MSEPQPSPSIAIEVNQLDPGLPLPHYAHAGDAGADLHSRIDVTIGPGERVLVPTGIAIAIPVGFVGLVHPRSGLAARSGVTVLNAPGTIDAGYRGEVNVLLLNTDRSQPCAIARGDRVAQLVVQRVATAQWLRVDSLSETGRGMGGFGSTGGFSATEEGR